MIQTTPAAIALAAMAGLGIAGAFAALVAAFNRPAARDRPPRPPVRRFVQTLAGGALAFALFGSFAVLALLLLSGALIAAEAPKAVYLFTGALAGFVLWRGVVHSSYGMEGCTRFWIISWGAYGLSWSAASLLLLPEEVGTTWSFAAIVRPMVVAAPGALLVFSASRPSRKTPQALGALAVVAALAALIFFPIEAGFAQDHLPRSDWLRFPLAGAFVFLMLMLIPRAIGAVVALRPGIESRRRAALRGVGMNLALATSFGALLGLLWAITRWAQGAFGAFHG